MKFSVDNSLSGYIAVYDTELDAGTYTMSYSGDVSSVSVYYEPNIDLTATLTDENGNVVSAESELYPGAYAINYGLVDKDGNVTTSNLLGKTSYTVTYTVNGEEKTVKSDKSGHIDLELNEGDVLDSKFTVTYLSGYTITKKASDFNWPFGGFKINPRPAGLLEMKVTGGQTEYKLSELEKFPYAVQLFYEGAPLTKEQLGAAELSVVVEGGNASCMAVPDGDGYILTLNYAGTAADTTCGDYVIRLNAQFTNEFGVVSQSKEVTVPFAVEDDGYGLEMAVEGENYFVISKLEESEPIKVILSADGTPLTDEQLAGVVLSVEGGGLTCESEPVFGESAFTVRIIKDDKAVSGSYDLQFIAAAKDRVGRDISAEDEMAVTLRTYPRWLPALIVFLILLVIAILIWLYMNMKVLPKKITVNAGNMSFRVNGDSVTGTAICKYTGGGKKTGTLSVKTPSYSDSSVNGGFNLSLQAVSPRRVKSGKRRVAVVKMSPINPGVVTSMGTGANILSQEREGSSSIWRFRGQEIPNNSVMNNFEIGHNCEWSYRGQTKDGNEIDFSLSVHLLFK